MKSMRAPSAFMRHPSYDLVVIGSGPAGQKAALNAAKLGRRVAAGRLSEILGPAALESDRFLRTLGVRRVAQANVARYDAETRRLLEAYAAGVNAFIGSNPVLPPEFWLTRSSPESWSPADSVAWVKMMAWDLGGNWRQELLRMRLAKTLPLARIHEFLPPYPGEPVPQIPDLKELYGSMELAPLTGLADAIVDLVSTGNTLKANNLIEVERIMDISSYLVVNQAALKLKQAPLRRIIELPRLRLRIK